MTHPHADRLPELAAETRAAAANVEHPWDRRALEWPLDSTSTVVEVGGYKGRWALQMVERYSPRMYVFEPQPWAADVCRAVLGDRAIVVNAALGDAFKPTIMRAWETDGCSLVGTGDHQVIMVEAGATFRNLKITMPDLLMMNIEGYEYFLLPYMLSRDIRPVRLVVQRHGTPEQDAGLERTLERAGYRELWTYGPVLTAWERA